MKNYGLAKKKTVHLPSVIEKAFRDGLIEGVIQFGSSLVNKRAKDVDVAIVIKSGCFSEFIKRIKSTRFTGIDLSLIREEELSPWSRFRFGSHGIHLIVPLKQGRVIFGKNSFLKAPSGNLRAVKRSIFYRLSDYMYEVRKSYFRKDLHKVIKSRYKKFVRLALFLLFNDLTYPHVLMLQESGLKRYIKKKQLAVDLNDVEKTYELLWEKLIKKGFS